MTDQTTGSGDERYPSGRFPRTPDDEWAPGDAAPGQRTPRETRPEERLPGEPAPGENAGRLPDEDAGGRLPGSAGPGREGLTADDRAPQDAARSASASGPGSGTRTLPHGSEGLRPGTEDLGSETPAESGRDDRLGAPSTGGAAGAGGSGTVGEAASASSGTGAPLLPHEEMDRWEQRIRQVVAGFVDEPRGAVEEADRALEEIAARFSEAVTRRRRTLRMSWEGAEQRGSGSETDTEQLRLALRDYRELAGRLLHS